MVAVLVVVGNYYYMEDVMPDYLTVQEVADLLRTSAETVRYWRHIGKGPTSFKVGRRVLFERAEVERFIEEARSAGAA